MNPDYFFVQLVSSGPGTVKPGENLNLLCNVTGFSITDSSYTWHWVHLPPRKDFKWIARIHPTDGRKWFSSSLQSHTTISSDKSKNEYFPQLNSMEVTVPQIGGCESLLLRLGPGGQLGLLLVYLSPGCMAMALPKLLDILSGVVVEFPNHLVLGHFSLLSLGEASSLVIQGLTHERGSTLDLVFISGHYPLSWTDHHLLQLDLPLATPCHQDEEPVGWFRPRCLMDPERFQMALGFLPTSLTHSSAEALVATWQQAALDAFDWVVPLRPLTHHRSQLAPWFSEELREMNRWRLSRSESDCAQLRSYIMTYLVAMEAVRCTYFSTLIASTDDGPAALVRVTCSLLHREVREDPPQGRVKEFSQHLVDKVAQIRASLTSEWQGSEEEVTLSLADSTWVEFDPVSLDEVARIMWRLNCTTCLLDPCPSWLVYATRRISFLLP
ncbi:hypothetical protein L345_17781, partial [Ophiophagus hannah]